MQQQVPSNRHGSGELRPKPVGNWRAPANKKHWMKKLSYKMIAERDSEKVKVERQSSLIIVAKARVFASAGWQVVITDEQGKSYAPPEFDRLLAA
jgi:outer membrane protease